MSIELQCLLWSTLLGLLHVVAQVVIQGRERTVPYQPNRDNEPEPGLLGGRAGRAMRNFLETYPLFVALTVVVVFSEGEDLFSEIGAIVYLVSRTAYLPLYVIGLGPVRSLFWSLSLLGLVAMFCGALF